MDRRGRPRPPRRRDRAHAVPLGRRGAGSLRRLRLAASRPSAAVVTVALLCILGAVLAPWLGGSTSSESTAETVVLRAGHSSNPDEPYHAGLLELARLVEEATEGRVRIEVFPAGQLGSERMMIEGLLLGTLDIVVAANGSATSFIPALGVLDLPYLFSDRGELFAALDGAAGDALRSEAAERGFRILGFLDAGVRHIMTRSQPVETMDDLRGLKIRTMPVPAHLSAFDAFGAQAVALNYGEVYGSLQTGLIDGAEAANTNFTRKNFYEVAPHWAQVGWIILVANMMMSEAAFQALPAELQAVLLDAAEAAAIHERRLYRESDEALLARIEALGVTVTHPDTTPFRAAAERLYPQLLDTPRQRELLEILRSSGRL